jgi:hypothetical protein
VAGIPAGPDYSFASAAGFAAFGVAFADPAAGFDDDFGSAFVPLPASARALAFLMRSAFRFLAARSHVCFLLAISCSIVWS